MLNKTYLWVILFLVALLTACRPIENYPETDGPLFSGNYAETPPAFDGQLEVVTWNIKFSRAIDTAIVELQTVEALQDADILLLQEMDEVGVEAIAQALKYNYVYYPASVHTRHDKNFGNAILSRWPITDSAKVILPHKNPKNQQIRIAVRARVHVGEVWALVYSTHTETAWLSQPKRSDQIETLLADISPDEQYVIVGGDFNTITQSNIQELTAHLAPAGLVRLSKGAGYTVEPGGAGLKFDHLFGRGLSAVENGAYSATQASDHFPLWAKMVFEGAVTAQPSFELKFKAKIGSPLKTDSVYPNLP